MWLWQLWLLSMAIVKMSNMFNCRAFHESKWWPFTVRSSLGHPKPKYFPPDELICKLSKCLECLEESEQKLLVKPLGLFAKNPSCQPQGNGRKSWGIKTHDDLKPLLVTKWVDYSNKYGFGAQLSDGSFNVRFNDGSKIAISPGKRWVYVVLKTKVRWISRSFSQ